MLSKKAVGWAVASALMVMAGEAAASGFALIEQSASGMGNAYAGGAASADDASTIFFNPAGMGQLSGKQIAVAAHAIGASVKFNGTASGLAPLQTAGLGNGGNAGGWALVPNGYFAMEVNPQTRIGLGVNAPFGMQTNYDGNWMGRFQAIKSKIQTVNLNPSFSYQFNDSFTLGAGVSYQSISGELTSMTNYSAAAFKLGGAPLLGAIGGAGKQGLSTLSGSDRAWGYNVGAMFNFGPNKRIGVAYRSRVKYNLSGAVSFANAPAALAAAFALQPVTLAITMPDSFSVSGFHQLNDKWDMMADATWTGWSVFQQLNVLRANGTSLTNTPEHWRNTWRVSVGANYHYSDQWLARAGVAYDQSPVPDAFRTTRIPDNNRVWLSLGGQYKPNKDCAFDFGYSHLFVSNAPLNQSAAANPDLAGKGYLLGSYNSSVDILSAQYTHNF